MGADLIDNGFNGEGFIVVGDFNGTGFTVDKGLTETGLAGEGLVGVLTADELLFSSDMSLELSLFQLFLRLSLAFRLGTELEEEKHSD